MTTEPESREAAKGVLDDVVTTATEELFAAYGLPVQISHAPWSELQSTLASVVGFTAEDFSGSLAIATSHDVLKPCSPPTAAPLEDWMGELGNQLLGRIKNRLLRHGAVLTMATPVVISGLELRTPPLADRCLLDYRFDTSRGPIFVRLDLSPTWQLRPALEDPDLTPANEGELLLF